MKPAPLALAAGAGLLLGWLLWGRGRVPDPALLARIDTVLVAGPATRDTVRIYVRRAAAHTDSAQQLAAQAEAAAAASARMGVERDSLARIVGDTAAAYRVCTAQVQTLRAGDLQWRAALRQCALATFAADSGRAVAEGRLNQVEPALADAQAALKRVRAAPRWTVGALWEPGGVGPVGGWVGRRVGPLVLQLEATDGPSEDPALRLGVGLGF